jgi:hypothetical protein
MSETSTGTILRTAAELLDHFGLWTGPQFADNRTGRLDICAAIYRAVTGSTPNCFVTDENNASTLIENNPDAYDAIKVVSAVLPTEPSTTDVGPYEMTDYVEHVSNWAATTPVFGDRPPTTAEVIGLLLRAADTADSPAGPRPGLTDDWGLCITCRGHGSVQGDEIPYDQLRPRQQQGYAHGRRYHRSEACPDCDGQDRVTDAAVSAHESAA